jgi:hypothetical protein
MVNLQPTWRPAVMPAGMDQVVLDVLAAIEAADWERVKRC